MSLLSDLYKIQKKDLKNTVKVLNDAFSEESMWKEVFNDEDKNRALTEVMVRFCLKYGNVLATSDNLEGVMAIAPYDKDMTALRIIRSGAFFLSMKISNEAKKLVGYCGIFCGSCGMFRGRIYAKIAQDFLEVMKAADYPEEITINQKGVKPDFDFNEFLKGVEYFSKEDSAAYCQEPCKKGGGVPCKNRLCAKERGLEICYECKDFPCEHFLWTFEKSPEKAKDYERFKKLGFEGWIRFHAERAEKGYSNATRKYYVQTKNEK